MTSSSSRDQAGRVRPLVGTGVGGWWRELGLLRYFRPANRRVGVRHCISRLDGSSTICEKITARAAANGRRTHHRCNVDGCPCRMVFSLALAALIASNGRATSTSFLFVALGMAARSRIVRWSRSDRSGALARRTEEEVERGSSQPLRHRGTA